VALKTGLEGKPWYIGLAVGLAAGLLLFGLGYWQYVQPKNNDYAGLEIQLADLQNKIQEGRAARQELPKFREEVRQLELELDKLLRILPARRNTPDMMRRIRSLTEQGDFALSKFNPGTLTDKEFFSEWPIAVSVRGSYHNLALFFDRISRFSRIINIENLEVLALPPSKEGHTLSASFTAKTFVYKETPAASPAGPAGAPGAPASAGPAASIRSGTAAAAGGNE
jgi:type IV pilus assembly protein PilO